MRNGERVKGERGGLEYWSESDCMECCAVAFNYQDSGAHVDDTNNQINANNELEIRHVPLLPSPPLPSKGNKY